MQSQESLFALPKTGLTINRNLEYEACRMLPDLLQLFYLSGPIILTSVLEILIFAESNVISMQLSEVEFDGVCLGNSILTAFGTSLGIAVCSACDTLFSQTFGSSQKTKLNVHLQRSLMIVSLFSILIWGVHLNAESIFLALGQKPLVAKIAAEYMLYFGPGLFFAFHYIVLARFMQHQNSVFPALIVCICGNIFNISSQLIFIKKLQFGYRAIAVCQFLTFVLIDILIAIFVIFNTTLQVKYKAKFTSALHNWNQFGSLALPGLAMVVLKSFYWEANTLIAGKLGIAELAQQSIAFQLQTLMGMCTNGIGGAVAILIGQALGGFEPERAKTIFQFAVFVGLIVSGITCILTVLCGRYLLSLFADSQTPDKSSNCLLSILAIFQIIDSFWNIGKGTLRGCGRQITGAVIVIASYYVIGLPVGVLTTLYAKLGTAGLWIGSTTGTCASVCILTFILITQNWLKQAELAQKRIEGNNYESNNNGFEYDDKTKLPDTTVAPIFQQCKNVISPVDTNSHYQYETGSKQQKISRYSTFSIILQRLVMSCFVMIFFLVMLIIRLSSNHEELYSPKITNMTDRKPSLPNNKHQL